LLLGTPPQASSPSSPQQTLLVQQTLRFTAINQLCTDHGRQIVKIGPSARVRNKAGPKPGSRVVELCFSRRLSRIRHVGSLGSPQPERQSHTMTTLSFFAKHVAMRLKRVLNDEFCDYELRMPL
jgi:hypothetical protein